MITCENNMYYFFLSARAGGILRILRSDCFWEWAEFFYLARQPGRNPSPGCVSLCNDLKFPFFDTEPVYIQKQIFIIGKRRGNSPVCKSPTAFAIKSGASQQLKK